MVEGRQPRVAKPRTAVLPGRGCSPSSTSMQMGHRATDCQVVVGGRHNIRKSSGNEQLCGVDSWRGRRGMSCTTTAVAPAKESSNKQKTTAKGRQPSSRKASAHVSSVGEDEYRSQIAKRMAEVRLKLQAERASVGSRHQRSP
jgi:hypothetical protein